VLAKNSFPRIGNLPEETVRGRTPRVWLNAGKHRATEKNQGLAKNRLRKVSSGGDFDCALYD
jgi:hypothetical protein